MGVFIFVSRRPSLLVGICVRGHRLRSCAVVFMGHWYGVEVGHWWLVVVYPHGHLHGHVVVVVAVFIIHPVTWHCHIAAVAICVCRGGCEQSLMVGDGRQWTSVTVVT